MRVRFSLFGRNGRVYTCDMAPPGELMRSFKPRNDDQIMALEILSIALGALYLGDHGAV